MGRKSAGIRPMGRDGMGRDGTGRDRPVPRGALKYLAEYSEIFFLVEPSFRVLHYCCLDINFVWDFAVDMNDRNIK
jgi:hypothetical protein